MILQDIDNGPILGVSIISYTSISILCINRVRNPNSILSITSWTSIRGILNLEFQLKFQLQSYKFSIFLDL